MSNDLLSKVTVVTGWTMDIGPETAVLFVKRGAKVVLSGRREAEGNQTLGQCCDIDDGLLTAPVRLPDQSR